MSRALTGGSYYDDSMTVEKCAAAAEEFDYFGLEYGRECYFGNSLQTGSSSAASQDCNTPCPGNKKRSCGGGNRLNLYEYTTTDVSTTTSSVLTTTSTIPTSASSDTSASSTSSAISTESTTTSITSTLSTTMTSVSSSLTSSSVSATVVSSTDTPSTILTTSTSVCSHVHNVPRKRILMHSQAASSTSSTAPSPTNLLQNAGFEATQTTSLPWATNAIFGISVNLREPANEQLAPHEGSQMMSITASGNQRPGNAQQKFPTTPNTKYIFSVWSWSPKITGRCYYNFGILNNANSFGTSNGSKNVATSIEADQGHWVQTSFTFNSGQYTQLFCTLQMNCETIDSKRTFYIDDVSIIPV